jgi:hypothetical protein
MIFLLNQLNVLLSNLFNEVCGQTMVKMIYYLMITINFVNFKIE